MNIHFILDDKLSDQQIKDFRNELRLTGGERQLSDDALADLVAGVADDKIKNFGNPAEIRLDRKKCLFVGSSIAEITKNSLFKALNSLPDGRALLFLPFDTYNGISRLDWKTHPLSATEFMSKAHIYEAKGQDVIDAFRGIKTDGNLEFFDSFLQTIGGKPKPVVRGSDAHTFNKYGVFPDPENGSRATWIKAIPTYRGLGHLRCEPASRIHIGEEPEKVTLVREHPTRFIDTIRIKKREGSEFGEHWFDANLALNHDLVAIIGNRGMGKSALADIIGLLGKSRNHRHFSFLTKDKFCQAKVNKASHFEATLVWKDGTTTHCKSLADVPSETDVERIRYLPQNYIDTICNEVKLKIDESFDSELNPTAKIDEEYGGIRLRQSPPPIPSKTICIAGPRLLPEPA